MRKAAGLIKLLALEPGHRMHREQAMDLLWPDLDELAARNNLHHALYVARRTLSPAPASCLSLHGEQLALYSDGPLWVDVEAFEEAVTAARRSREPAAYEAAIGLYAGDLFPGDVYEGWTEDSREGLRRTHLALHVELAVLHEKRGEPGAAIEALERVVAQEPSHEEAHVGLMRLHALSGRQTEALRQYERLEEVLAREYAVEPTAASRRLYEEVLAGTFSPSRPEEAGARRLPEEPPGASRHNLPASRSSFVEREREQVEVKRDLAMTRLLTLTGAGGSGKTRLALEVARDLVGIYPDGAWLVELAPLSEEALVPQEVAQALKVREQPGRPLVATLADHLRTRKLLLILDNCEHVVDASAHLVDELLSSCPGLRVLATSREALRVSGEIIWRVPALSLPEGREELLGYGSVRLFVERARSRRPDFELTRENAGAMADICRRLDGIPLAIELAAARVGVLSAEQIAARLDDSLALLRGGGRTALPRQQTLRGTLDWSFALLSEPEKSLFDRLSVFAGGWTLEAAEMAGGTEGVLELLVDKSLVVAEGASRYRFLEPVRQYARERLQESGGAEETHRRHALWYLALAEEAEPELVGAGQEAWFKRLETEHDNLRAALRWSLERGESELGHRLAGTLGREFWRVCGHLREGLGWLEATLEGGKDGSPARARALAHAGWMAWQWLDFGRSTALSDEALTLSRKLGDKEAAAVAHHNLGGLAAFGRGKHGQVIALCEEGLALARQVGNTHAVAYITHVLAASEGAQDRRSARPGCGGRRKHC